MPHIASKKAYNKKFKTLKTVMLTRFRFEAHFRENTNKQVYTKMYLAKRLILNI